MNSTSDELSDVRLFKYARKFHNVLFHPCYPDGKKHNEKEKNPLFLVENVNIKFYPLLESSF